MTTKKVRPEPQTAPSSTCAENAQVVAPSSLQKTQTIPTCSVTGAIPGDGGACGDCDPCIIGEASVPEAVKRLIAEKNSLIARIGELEGTLAEIASVDNNAHVDAERQALAENIEKYCKAIDEAGEKGWRGAVMGDRVELGRLTHENRNLIIFSLRAGGWREDMPPVSVGCEREFIVAVYRASSGKAYTFAASYLNAYPLQYEHECPKWKEGVGCSGEGCDDGCPTTGWFEQTGDDDYSSMYNRLELREGDIFLGWSELPKWNGPLPSAPHTDKER